ncbi:MAG: isocitrate lyase/PEP mutase family protein [Peptococcaceae bacterium]|nr:isocitrate lyase/PEP mutase family protein [Peptococcaceae bacterium]
MKNSTKLRQLFNEGKFIVAPGAHDALTAKIIGKVGFDAVYMTGYGQAASHLGCPDVGLMTFTEMLARANAIVEAAGVPVVADADTGFGNAVNVMRTVKEYEKAGVAVIQLEDQVMPKKCGHMTGRQVVPMEEMVGKIKAAVDARTDADFMIMARTDARTVHGIEEAIRRGRAYKEAGADIIFIESPESEEEMKKINESIPGLTLANMVEGGRTPLLPNQKLEELGYNLVIYPTASTYATTKAMVDLMEGLKKDDTTATMIGMMIDFPKFNDLIGLPQIREIEAKYGR